MAYASFAEWLVSRRATPAFLKAPWAQKVLFVKAYKFDVVQDSLSRAVTAGWCDHFNTPSDALDLIGRSRMIARYPGEDDEAYSARLLSAWDLWQTAGSKDQLETELHNLGLAGAFIVANWEWDGTEVRVPIDNLSGAFQNGETLTVDGGTFTAELVTAHPTHLRVANIVGGTPTDGLEWVGDTSGATADQDGSLQTEWRPAWSAQEDIDNWSRFWVYIPHTSHSFTTGALWSDPGVWDDGGVWDYEGFAPQQLNDIRNAIENYRSAHEIPVRLRFFTSTGTFDDPDDFNGTSFTVEMYG